MSQAFFELGLGGLTSNVLGSDFDVLKSQIANFKFQSI